jgi:hypothetical protein
MRNGNVRTKAGKLSAYGFACGYVEEREASGIRTVLSREPNGYHVHRFDHNNHERVFWEVCEKLSDARKLFRKEET